MNKGWLYLVLFCLSYTASLPASECKGHFVNPITDVCWSCLFPLTIGRSEVVKSHYPDTKNPSRPFCSCPNKSQLLGVNIGLWEPFALVDVTRKPYCMVNLGVQLNIKNQGLGGSQLPDTDGRGAFYYVHWYKYPLMYWLQILLSVGCMEEAQDFDVLFPSELDPTWNDSSFAFSLNPEATLFTSPPAREACALDASTAFSQTAVDSLFWCQGAQGSTYPLTGFVANQASPISAATLLAERADFKLHRIGAIRDSVGKNSPAICKTYQSAILPKSRYRYQLVNTLPDARRCHPFGHSVITWEAGHTYPSDGDNFGFLIWRKKNCCFL